jgi:hypothetical protein
MSTPRPEHDEAPFRRTLTTLALFSAVTAVAGGIDLMVFSRGGRLTPPIELLEHTPFTSFFVPGLLLTFVVGGTSLVAAVLTWQGSRAATEAAVLAGGTLVVWIVVQVALIRSFSTLHAVYGALGAAMIAFGVARRARHIGGSTPAASA